MQILQYLNLFKLSTESSLYFYSMLIVDITALILLFAVIYKFYEHSFKPNKLQKNKKHFFSTFLMTVLVLALFNLWNSQTGQLYFTDKITEYAYFLTGAILIFTGLIWHIWSKINIGKFWSDSIEIKEDHKIIRTGAYKWARHPMYASLLMWCLGAGLILANWASLATVALLFFPLMIIRAKAEEKELVKVDIDYNLYRENTKMLCPTLKGKLAIFIRVIALVLFAYFTITGIDLQRLILLFFIQVYLGFSLTPEKVAFAYRTKSIMLVCVWLISKFLWSPIYYFYYFMILTFLYGLKWNCPCMIVYEKFGGCVCLKLIKKLINKGSK